jgi:hypothetical protein
MTRPRLNREWHEAHRLPRNAKLAERVDWHLEHERVCGCREMPASIKAELERREERNRQTAG